MTLASLAIDADEWNLVACLVSRLQPDETGRAPGVALRERDGQRLWTIRTPWMAVEVTGGGEGDQLIGDSGVPLNESIWLPTRLVVHAAELATPEGSCSLIIGAQSATVGNRLGNAHFDLPEVEPGAAPKVLESRRGTPSASARTTAGKLLHLLRTARRLPTGVDLSVTTAPDLWLGVEDGFVAATVAWSHFGAPRVTVRAPATTSGEALVRVPHFDLAWLLDSFHERAFVQLEVVDERNELWLQGESWTATVALTQMPSVLRAADEVTLDEVLAQLGVTESGDRCWTLEVGGELVGIEENVLPGMPWPTVRAVVVLAVGVDSTEAVLAEINAINSGLVGIRIWFREGALIAAVDLPTHHVRDLGAVIGELVRQTADIGPLVAMFGGSESARGPSEDCGEFEVFDAEFDGLVAGQWGGACGDGPSEDEADEGPEVEP